jgi:hypothetical protein
LIWKRINLNEGIGVSNKQKTGEQNYEKTNDDFDDRHRRIVRRLRSPTVPLLGRNEDALATGVDCNGPELCRHCKLARWCAASEDEAVSFRKVDGAARVFLKDFAISIKIAGETPFNFVIRR